MKTISIGIRIKMLSILFGTLWASLVLSLLFYNTKAVSQELDPRVVLTQLVDERVQADISAVKELAVGLFVTTCLTVDKGGGQLGDGNGFFDLAYSLFSVQRGVAENAVVCAVVGEEQINTGFLPQDPWDVKADFIVTRKEIIPTSAEKDVSADILWEILPEKRIRKITPLWQLYKQKS